MSRTAAPSHGRLVSVSAAATTAAACLVESATRADSSRWTCGRFTRLATLLATVDTRDGGALDQLRELTDRRARQLPWGEAQAATWILTHITPLAQVLTVRRHETTLSGIGTFPAIDMRIDPRVHPDAVLAAYRMARRNIMGPRVRPLGKKAAELVDFVHTHGGPAEWRVLYKRWATTNPESWQDHDGRWAAQIDLGWEAGKRRCKTVYGRTRAEVADKLHTIQQQGRGGIVIALPSPLSSTRGLTPSSRPPSGSARWSPTPQWSTTTSSPHSGTKRSANFALNMSNNSSRRKALQGCRLALSSTSG
jgi:hypothetical protein